MKIDSFPILIITAGILLVIIGLLWLIGTKTGINFGKLPGDIKVENENFSFYFPLTTSILLSIVLSLIIYVILKIAR